MRRWLCGATAALCFLCGGCARETSVVGCWVNDDPSTYYFQLYDDGTCLMFDSNDQWVASGTYTADDDGIYFETDTGSFDWSKRDEGMVFEAGGHTIVYHLQ